jgi:ribosomal protein S4
LGIAPTRAAARQLVSHKHITVDGKVVNIPSFSVKVAKTLQIHIILKKDYFLGSIQLEVVKLKYF